MSRPMVRIYQGEGEFIDREMNDDEFAQYKLDVAARAAEKEAEEAKATAKAELLNKLGITAEEAALLLS